MRVMVLMSAGVALGDGGGSKAPMQFRDFWLSSSPGRRDPAGEDELRTIGALIERERVVERLPPHNTLRVLLHDAVPAGATLQAAHETWSPAFFAKVTTPEGFPRQPDDAVCPA